LPRRFGAGLKSESPAQNGRGFLLGAAGIFQRRDMVFPYGRNTVFYYLKYSNDLILLTKEE
jgi:hypothetical protein